MSRLLSLVLTGASALALATVAAPAPTADAPATTAPTGMSINVPQRTGNWCC